MEKKIEKITSIIAIVDFIAIIVSLIWILTSKHESIIPFYLLTISFLIAIIIIALSFKFKVNKALKITYIVYLVVSIIAFFVGPAFRPCAGCQESIKCTKATQCKENKDGKTNTCHYYTEDGSVSKDTITCNK